MRNVGLFSYVGLEERKPSDHPLRAIRALADEALASLNGCFEQLYSRMGRPSIVPEMMSQAALLSMIKEQVRRLRGCRLQPEWPFSATGQVTFN